MSAPAGYVVDHIDNNPLNNTRENLQITTTSRNAMRAEQALKGGVQKQYGRFRARIRVDGRHVSLGMFDTEDEARAMVNAARRLAWGLTEFNERGTRLR